MDLFPRPLLPEEHFDAVKYMHGLWILIVRVMMVILEAIIIKPRKGGTYSCISLP